MMMAQSGLGQNILVALNEQALAESALSHFSIHHPLHSSFENGLETPEIVSYIESEGLLKVSIQNLVDGVNQSSGEVKFYLSGLVSGYFYVRTIISNLSRQGFHATEIAARSSVIDEVTAMCEKQIAFLCSRPYSMEHAHAYGVAETAACLLLHLSPKQGGDILDRLYSRH